jgi:hypothetical protein
MKAVAAKLGIGAAETVRTWVRKAEVGAGQRLGVTSEEATEIKWPHRPRPGRHGDPSPVCGVGQGCDRHCGRRPECGPNEEKGGELGIAAENIDDVVDGLAGIVREAGRAGDRGGYFAALYGR